MPHLNNFYKKIIFILVTTMIGVIPLSSCNHNNVISIWCSCNTDLYNKLVETISEYKIINNINYDFQVINKDDYDLLNRDLEYSFINGSTPNIVLTKKEIIGNFINSSNISSKFINLLEYKNKLSNIDNINSYFLNDEYIIEGLYGLPYLKSSEVLIYNKEVLTKLFDILNISSDITSYMSNITYNQLLYLSEEILKNSAKLGLNLENLIPMYIENSKNFFITSLYQNDEELFELNNNKVNFLFNRDNIKDLFEFYKEAYDNSLISTKEILSEEGNKRLNEFSSIFVITPLGYDGFGNFSLNNRFEVTKPPSYNDLNNKYIDQGLYFGIISSTNINEDELNESINLLNYLLNDNINLEISYFSGGYIPTNQIALNSNEYQNYLSLNDYYSKTSNIYLDSSISNLINYPIINNLLDIYDSVESLITSIFIGNKDIDSLFNECINNLNYIVN